jgi:DNA-binding NtrC family response regulator
MADGRTVTLGDLPREVLGDHPPAQSPRPAAKAHSDELAHIQRAHVAEVLRRERGNKARAARVLGINRRSLYRLLDRYNLRAERG